MSLNKAMFSSLRRLALAMRITQALHRAAANFVYAADW
jgi:hypothetical protein